MAPDRAGLWARRSVRSQITLLATALVALMLIASAVGLVTAQREVLTHGIDESLVQRADNIQARVEADAFDDRLPNDGDPEDSFLQLLDADGDVLAATANARGMDAAVTALPAGAGDRIDAEDGISVSGGDFRVLSRSVAGPGGAADARTLVVGKNLDDVEESVAILTTSLAIAIPVVTALLALLTWWVVGRVLRPVEAIRAEVSSIRGSQLHRRVPVPATEDEIARLAVTMNEMLDRVQTANDRQRRFVADASHELRGPLTRIRSSLEVGLAQPEVIDPVETQQSVLGDVVDMQQLVDDLLFLARSESGGNRPVGELVDLDDLVLAEAKRLRERGTVQVDSSAVGAARTVGDAGQLSRAVRNLVDNAERHARSQVCFELSEQDGSSMLVVADDGPGIAPEHRAEVFKRFARLDAARSRDDGGSGLGLAIVQDIVERHAGQVSIEGEGGARFVLRLPRAE